MEALFKGDSMTRPVTPKRPGLDHAQNEKTARKTKMSMVIRKAQERMGGGQTGR